MFGADVFDDVIADVLSYGASEQASHHTRVASSQDQSQCGRVTLEQFTDDEEARTEDADDGGQDLRKRIVV